MTLKHTQVTINIHESYQCNTNNISSVWDRVSYQITLIRGDLTE